jgi:hypothetical protein
MREHYWEKAAECAARADKAVDTQTWEFFVGLRDAWISVANRSEMIEAVDGPSELPELQLANFPTHRRTCPS